MAVSPLGICLCVIRWAPVVFITSVVVWSYYAYVIQMCLFTVDSIPEKVIYLLCYHPLLIIFAWAYWQTIFTEGGSVPKEFYLPSAEAERFCHEENEDVQREILARHGRTLPVQCRTASGAFRYCEKCKAIKPDRAHHCSVCGKCVLKMDHHCPWVNNCVSFTNYKFFVLFLGYALVYCIFVAATSLQYFIKFWTGEAGNGMGKFHTLFLFFASVMFAISLVSLFGYHLYLTCVNRSTLESFRAPIFRSGPDKDGFSLGRYSNFIEVFGDVKRYWVLPLFTSVGDGVQYPTRVLSQEGNTYHTMDINEPAPHSADPENPSSFGDGVNYPIRTIDEDYDSLLGQRQRWMEDGGDDPECDSTMMQTM